MTTWPPAEQVSGHYDNAALFQQRLRHLWQSLEHMHRRELLRALLVSAAFCKLRNDPPRPDDAAVLSALCERLLPRDDELAGARNAGADPYVAQAFTAPPFNKLAPLVSRLCATLEAKRFT